MHTETCSYKRRLNGWALSIWIFGGLIALVLICVAAWDRGNADFGPKRIITAFADITTYLYLAYLSIPFFVLGISTKVYFQRQVPTNRDFFTRIVQIVCGFILTEYFYYAFIAYVQVYGHMFSPLGVVFILLPFAALLPLLLGLLIGGVLGNGIIFLFPYFFEKSDKPR